MTELCFDDCTCGNLYEINSTDGNALNSEDIIILDLRLNYGSLKGDIFKNQAEREIKIYQSFFDDNGEKELISCYRQKLRSIDSALSRLNTNLKDGKEIRLWLSNNAFDRCALYWFCDYAKKYDCKIYVVLCPGFEQKQGSNENTRWAASSNLSYMASFAEKSKRLLKEQIDLYADLWKKSVEENAALRVLIDVLRPIRTNRFWRIKFSHTFAAKPCNTPVLLHFAASLRKNFITAKTASHPKTSDFSVRRTR